MVSKSRILGNNPSMTYVSSKYTKSKMPVRPEFSMTSSVRRKTNIAKHKEKILGVINQLNEEELEQVSELLKQSDAGAEDNEAKVDELEEEYAAAILRDAEEGK